MQLSIVIVNWNTRQMLQDCLTSVFSGIDGVEAEVLVVDNASTDGSVEMVQAEFPEVVLIRNAENRGFAAANNQALAIARGCYVLLLNSDTVVHGDVLGRSVEYLDAHEDVGVMGCRVLNTDGTVQLTCNSYPTLVNLVLLTSGLWKLDWPPFCDRYLMRRWQRDHEQEVDVVSGCYMLVRATAIERIGLLDENFFFYGEETDWCKRFHDAGWKLCFAPVGEITHHGEGSARKLSFKRDLMLASAMVKLHRKHFGVVSAALAWTILFVFHSTRAVFWTAVAVVSNKPSARERRELFWNLTKSHHLTWAKMGNAVKP